MGAILIFTNKEDIHADLVIKKLRERGEFVFRFNSDDFPVNSKITITLEGGQLKIKFTTRKGTLCAEDIKSIWFRRWSPIGIDPAIDETHRQFIEEETKMFMRGLWAVLKGFWVNNPNIIFRAQNKIYQLMIAQEIGFNTPYTLFSNSPDDSSRLSEQYPALAYKSMSGGLIQESSTHKEVVLTKRLPQRNKTLFESVRYCPSLLQPYIEKKYELRITVVGDQMFPCAIYSQDAKSDEVKIDWRRHYELENIKHEACRLPAKIEEKCRCLLARLEINFGAIDMIVSPDDEYIFLEINPNGQWLWIEQLAGLKISDALANILIRAKP